MAAEVPIWCHWCGAELEHHERTSGRARTYCRDTCRQAAHRQTQRRQQVAKSVGLSREQVDLLFTLFRVTPRAARRPKRDA
jgi:hypothetical protein